MIVFLVGMMGSGKTTIGKALAKELKFAFVDTDTLIETNEKKTIAEIFKSEGEEYFRELENKIISKMQLTNTIVATGGGLPCFNNMMEVLNNKGITFHLKCGTSILVERLLKSSDRPLLLNKNKQELFNLITNLKRKRNFYYNQSNYVILGKKDKKLIVRNIFQKLITRNDSI